MVVEALRRVHLRRWGYVAALAATAALAGCGGSGSSAAGSASATQAAAGAGAGSSTSTLDLSGSPSTVVAAGSTYSFQPSLNAASGATVGYSVQNLPSWAAFSTVTGQLQGTPEGSDVGVYPNIVISAGDGHSLASLRAFSITVQAASSGGPGTASLAWVAPTTNSDGTPLTDLTDFRIYYGTDSSSLDSYIDVVADGNLAGFVVSGLSPGTYYFKVSALDSAGVEGAQSNEVSRVVS